MRFLLRLLGAAVALIVLGSGLLWLFGALSLGFVVPFTILVIKPVNDQLLDPDLDASDPRVPELLRRWGSLHWVRTASSALCVLGRASA